MQINADSGRILTFIEVRVELRGHASNVLRQYAEARGEHPASPAPIIVMQEVARPERFAALERQAPTEATADARELTALTRGLMNDLTAPPDQRFSREFGEISTSVDQRVDARANLYVITNLEITASNLTQFGPTLHNLAAAAGQSRGNLGVEVLRLANHPNHFTLISAWIGEAPFHEFAASVEARQFRQIIAPLLGSPYDERLFCRVD